MSQFYWNEPSTGASMSAEEFAAGACQRPGPQPCHSSCGCAASVPTTGCGVGQDWGAGHRAAPAANSSAVMA